MKKNIRIFPILLLFLSCQDKFEKNIEKYSENNLFKNGQNFSVDIKKIDTLSKTDVKIDNIKSDQESSIEELKNYSETINNNNILISKIRDAKIVKPNKINLYAFKNNKYGEENTFYELTWDMRVATTKEKDIAKILTENSNLEIRKKNALTKITNSEKQINLEKQKIDKSIENYKVQANIILDNNDNERTSKYIFTLNDKIKVISSKKEF